MLSVNAEPEKQNIRAPTAYEEIDGNVLLIVEDGRVTTVGHPGDFYGLTRTQINRIAIMSDNDFQELLRKNKHNFSSMTNKFPWKTTSNDQTISKATGGPYPTFRRAAFIESRERWLSTRTKAMLRRNEEFHIIWGGGGAWNALQFKASRVFDKAKLVIKITPSVKAPMASDY